MIEQTDKNTNEELEKRRAELEASSKWLRDLTDKEDRQVLRIAVPGLVICAVILIYCAIWTIAKSWASH